MDHIEPRTAPQIHLLNLDRSEDRLRRFWERNSHLEGLVERVPAIDGVTLDRDELLRTGYILDDLTYGRGSLGCVMSHIRLWEMAVAEDRSITILEDDAVASQFFVDISRDVINSLPRDWDIIHWGYNFNPAFAWVDVGASKVRLHCYGQRQYREPDEFKNAPVAPAALKLLHCFGHSAYSISPSGARAALKYLLPLRSRSITFPGAGVRIFDRGFDIALCGAYPQMKAYLAVPQIVAPFDDGISDRKATDGSLRADPV